MITAKETRRRILDAAEQLFAERGFSATSIRAITSRANVNLASIHYHFRSKRALIEAVYARRLRPLNEERLRILSLLESAARKRALSVEQILEAFIRPLFHVLDAQDNFDEKLIPLLIRAYAEPEVFFGVGVTEQFRDVVQRYQGALMKTLPGAETKELFMELHFVLGAAVHVLGYIAPQLGAPYAFREVDPNQRPQFRVNGNKLIEVEAIFQKLILFSAAGIRASCKVSRRTGRKGTGKRSEGLASIIATSSASH